ncbi:MAG TPA: tRNA dimethylallyltransferase, partial [Gammaproteobacteria bacterium]|nr:tRNA dimethylallyltransferase [Gammaproteobacteria bacterium]
LEVHRLTGRPLSELQRAAGRGPRPSVTTLALVPPDRADLGERIERRFDAMVEAGFVSEVQELRARGDLGMDTPSMRAVGYRQVWGYLAGHYEWPVARSKAIAATRQLAKRQMTWLRSERDIERFEPLSPDLAEKLLERISSEFARWSSL